MIPKLKHLIAVVKAKTIPSVRTYDWATKAASPLLMLTAVAATSKPARAIEIAACVEHEARSGQREVSLVRT